MHTGDTNHGEGVWEFTVYPRQESCDLALVCRHITPKEVVVIPHWNVGIDRVLVVGPKEAVQAPIGAHLGATFHEGDNQIPRCGTGLRSWHTGDRRLHLFDSSNHEPRQCQHQQQDQHTRRQHPVVLHPCLCKPPLSQRSWFSGTQNCGHTPQGRWHERECVDDQGYISSVTNMESV